MARRRKTEITTVGEIIPIGARMPQFIVEYPTGKGKRARTQKISKENFRRANAIVRRYHVVVWGSGEHFLANSLELPLRIGVGKTFEECCQNLLIIMAYQVGALLQMQVEPPKPVIWPVKVKLVAADDLKAELGVK
ncbi:MAG: hypothetical protein WC845_02700 [Candidatus Staskawiczbacteria bacterium]|jgi:hypothetical protein